MCVRVKVGVGVGVSECEHELGMKECECECECGCGRGCDCVSGWGCRDEYACVCVGADKQRKCPEGLPFPLSSSFGCFFFFKY